MANSFGLLLLAIVSIFIVARCMKDAKAFTRFMAVLVIGLLVGAGVKVAVNKITATTSPEKTVVIEKCSEYSTHTSTPFVLETGLAKLECASKNQRSDNFSTETEGIPTLPISTAGIDDS